MLVLSRGQDEGIVINDQIIVTVVRIQGDRVRLGIEASKGIPVHRREVHERIQRGEPPRRGKRGKKKHRPE